MISPLRSVVCFLPVVAVAVVAGCATRDKNRTTGTTEDWRPHTGANTPAEKRASDSEGGRKTENQGDLFKLPAHEVRESAFSDFGMSVKTNLEVKWGGDVEWMLVIGVDAGSSAAKADLKVGDRILAVDGRVISELSRDAMLAALFQRKKGDRAEFLVLGVRQSLPRFVTLVANRAGAQP